MRDFLKKAFGLDLERSIWVEEEELGKKKAFYHKKKRYFVKIPQKINTNLTLRLRGFGRKRGKKTGHLFLHVWLNKGENVRKNLWLSETSARNGAYKKILSDGKQLTMVIPPKCYHGLTIRLKGYGKESRYGRYAPVLEQKKRGNLLVKLFVYPDSITPKYGSFEYLSTENMALEGWVYRKFDDVIQKMGMSSFPAHPIQTDEIANLINGWGWMSIFHALVRHLKLEHLKIWLEQSNSISLPGSCKGTVTRQGNTQVESNYTITINEQFIDNPFSVAAILAHELCHVVYFEKFEDISKLGGLSTKSDQATLEMERTVDLLVFMYKIGEFQLRVARDKRLTIGYFNQEIFERIQVIVSRKLNSL